MDIAFIYFCSVCKPEHRVGEHHGGGEKDEGEVRRGHAGLVRELALLSLWEIPPEV